MGALPPISPWKPEDDLLLKNAVEAGASLEALAKGAVRFSRKFTIREIQERWHSILYDPDISIESAAHMIELERPTSGLPLNNKSSRVEASKEGREGQKRKVKTVRNCYYAIRKRIRSDPLNPFNLDFLVPPIENCYGDGNEAACPSNILEDPMGSHLEIENANFEGMHYVCPENIDAALLEFDNRNKVQLENHPTEQMVKEGNHVFHSPVSECEASFQQLQYSSPPEMHEWRNLNSMSAMEIGENQDIGDPFALPDEVRGSPSDYDVVHTETDFKNHIACDEMKASSSHAQYDLDSISDTLLNLCDDDMLLMDDEGLEIDKYGLGNLLLDSPSDMNEDQMLNVTHTSVAPEASIGQLDTSPQIISEEPKLSPISDTNPQITELCNDVICCTLNTEDLEVPDNDHIILPCKSLLPSSNRRGFNEISRQELSIKHNSHKQERESSLSLVHRELKIFAELHTDSQARGNKMGLNHAGECDTNLQPPKRANFNTDSRNPGIASCSTVIIRKMASENVSRKHPSFDTPKLPVKSFDGLSSRFQIGASGVKQEREPVKKLEVNTQSETADEMARKASLEEPSSSDVEEQPSDDDDIPCVSDIESMFHDMDLFPEDLDSYSSRIVAKYQSEGAKRLIIRLEQAAHASTHRDIASHGAFAYLYGRDKKSYYIKKPEVLLGRATEDVLVDIDLGKERRANKISRRQAIIKMDDDGEFHLKNLGKCPIQVDDKEVHPGQSMILHSNCYVQIREMPFKFEKNQARVKQYLDAKNQSTQLNNFNPSS